MASGLAFLPHQFCPSIIGPVQTFRLSNNSPSAKCRPKSTAVAVVTAAEGMRYKRLGSSDLVVSEVCLGTMTWGMKNDQFDAHTQIDYARSRGINFIDTAEKYPIPIRPPNHSPGTTEQILGSYLARNPGARSNLIISSKVMGYRKNSHVAANRVDSPIPLYQRTPFPDARLNARSIKAACNASLRRLQTDYLDMYILHWPDRYCPLFGKREYRVENERDSVPICETLMALKDLMDEGKIRAYGLSNETTFGVCEFVRIADQLGMSRPVSIQNSFCLLDRQFECELAEACSPRNYNIGLLPWSILAGGTLTGKYRRRLEFVNDRRRADEGLENARFVENGDYMQRFQSQAALKAAAKYEEIAKGCGMSLATLAQSFCKSRWYVTSSIVGATKLEQLAENIDAFEVDLDEDTLRLIDEVHCENKDIARMA